MITRSAATLQMVIPLMLAAALAASSASVALGADRPAPCRVRNVTQETFGRSMVDMVARASSGDRLLFGGICRGHVSIDLDITIVGRGERPTLAKAPTAFHQRVVRVVPGVDVVLADLIVEGGSAGSRGGGGIKNEGTLRLDGVVVQNNTTSGSGGGISSSGTLTMVDSTIRRNHGWSSGGLSPGGTATLVRTKVVGNSASDQGSGGGLGNHGTLTIRDSVIARNKVDFGGGGGIYNRGTLTLIDSVVRSNVVRLSYSDPGWGSGGGIQNSGDVDLIGSMVARNTSADEGGGIYNWEGDGTVTLDAASSVTGNVPDDCVGTAAC